MGRIDVSPMLYRFGSCIENNFFLGPAACQIRMLCRANSTTLAAAKGFGTQICQIRPGRSPVDTAGKLSKRRERLFCNQQFPDGNLNVYTAQPG
jgi:hypothetical protein